MLADLISYVCLISWILSINCFWSFSAMFLSCITFLNFDWKKDICLCHTLQSNTQITTIFTLTGQGCLCVLWTKLYSFSQTMKLQIQTALLYRWYQNNCSINTFSWKDQRWQSGASIINQTECCSQTTSTNLFISVTVFYFPQFTSYLLLLFVEYFGLFSNGIDLLIHWCPICFQLYHFFLQQYKTAQLRKILSCKNRTCTNWPKLKQAHCWTALYMYTVITWTPLLFQMNIIKYSAKNLKQTYEVIIVSVPSAHQTDTAVQWVP